jgi:hypothetical protein
MNDLQEAIDKVLASIDRPYSRITRAFFSGPTKATWPFLNEDERAVIMADYVAHEKQFLFNLARANGRTKASAPGQPVDRHCPNDQAQLRIAKAQGYDMCPVCRAMFPVPEQRL